MNSPQGSIITNENVRGNSIEVSGQSRLFDGVPVVCVISSYGLSSKFKLGTIHSGVVLPDVGVCGITSGEFGVDSSKLCRNSGKSDLLRVPDDKLPVPESTLSKFKLSSNPNNGVGANIGLPARLSGVLGRPSADPVASLLSGHVML